MNSERTLARGAANSQVHAGYSDTGTVTSLVHRAHSPYMGTMLGTQNSRARQANAAGRQGLHERILAGDWETRRAWS